MTLRSVFLTALIMAICWYWLKSRELKEYALRAAIRHCEDLGVSLLDQSVVLRSIKPKRDVKGMVRLYRRYVFDFTSTGEQRYQGEVEMIGRRIERIKLAPHRVE